MNRCWIGLTLWLLSPFAAWGAEQSLPPTQQLLHLDESGQWQLQTQYTVCKVETRVRTVTKKIPESKTVTEMVDGKSVVKMVTEYKEVSETQTYSVVVPDYQSVVKSIPASQLKAFETDGRVIPLEKLRSRIGAEALVVVSATDAKLPEAYANLFKPGTIIMAIATKQVPTPQQSTPVGAAPSPATVAVPAAPAVSAPLARLPRSPAPQFVMLGRSGPDDIVLRRTSESTSPVTAMSVFKKGATQERAPITLMQTVRQSEDITLAARHLQFNLGDSINVPFERIKERMARDMVVAYSTDGEEIDPFWLQNLKSTSLVVVGPQLPSSALCSPAQPAAMPAPVVNPGPFAPQAIPTPAVTPRPAPPAPQQAPAPPHAPAASPTVTPNPTQQSAIERELIDRANAERKKAGLTPLIAEQLLNLAASAHGLNLAKRATLSHELDEQSVGDRLIRVGFAWVKCGENIARGQETPTEAIDSWMKSPGHRANMLGATYTHIGVACSQDADGQKYWTMVLAQTR